MVSYSEYGSGGPLLMAFHGYGMNGEQFQMLQTSLMARYTIIGFHLPYHRDGPDAHHDWIPRVMATIRQLLHQKNRSQFSLAGYSIGVRICLHLLVPFAKNLQHLYLFAPYGLERHLGLQFVSKGLGHRFFKWVLHSRVPELLVLLVKHLRFIDEAHHQIIQRELLTYKLRNNLCRSLNMTGELHIDKGRVIALLNEHDVATTIVYGRHDVLFPYHGRNQKLLGTITNSTVLEVNEGHWMTTRRLDHLLNQHLS